MREKLLIAIGFVAFLLLAAYPVWNGLAAVDAGKPVLPPAVDPTGCVEDTLFMRANHPALLEEWRNAVVRDGERYYTATSGEQFVMSLTSNCLVCHADKDAFCTACHDYANVKPTCWNCHIALEGS